MELPEPVADPLSLRRLRQGIGFEDCTGELGVVVVLGDGVEVVVFCSCLMVFTALLLSFASPSFSVFSPFSLL